MKKIVSALFIVIILSGCDRDNGSSVANKNKDISDLPGEVVDISEALKNPAAFEGKEIKFYLKGVRPKTVDEQNPYGALADDDRIYAQTGKDGWIDIIFPSSLEGLWKAQSFENNKSYIVTFSGKINKQKEDGINSLNRFEVNASDFIVNWQDDYGTCKDERFFSGGLPNEVQIPPMPVAIESLKDLELFPEKYSNVSTSLTFRKEDLTLKNGEYFSIEAGGFTVIIKKNITEKIYSEIGVINTAYVVGRSVPAQGDSKKPEFHVTSMCVQQN